MTSSRPYLIRAIYEWIVDNGLTPHLLVDAAQDVVVPREYVEAGRIVLNVAPMAVNGLHIGNEEVTFSARFGGRPMNVQVPVERVLAIYTRENGQGMMFAEPEEGDGGDEPPPEGGDGPDGGDGGGRKGPSLRVVK
ncbi:ClpXP protease specificity-enhancing factor [Ectothiorhodospira mobilis]|uniref:ClpXP protease specificity-enhancing factor n=1 Tax=Ectothiorhodospira mobilis TaxID=195064 RepID=UPI00190490C2|nr:ClpXP protease specificity-enhancing factor [Ectothiorhodospira mobilis]MBK1692702.1 ClpXP protease specificity-enhancing factor [Ectothiorhodospira mobilis]